MELREFNSHECKILCEKHNFPYWLAVYVEQYIYSITLEKCKNKKYETLVALQDFNVDRVQYTKRFDIVHGEYKEWLCNGNLKTVKNYYCGVLHGLRYVYKPTSGNLYGIIEYNHGTVVRKTRVGLELYTPVSGPLAPQAATLPSTIGAPRR